jgi:hypothetical protein
MDKKLTRKGLTFSAVDAFGDPLETELGGWARPYATGAASPLWYASGDDDEDEDDDKGDKDDEEDEEDDEENDDDEDKGKTPEQLAAEVKTLRAAYLKKLKNSKNRGTRIKELETTKAKYEADFALLQEQFDELKKTAGKEVDSEGATKRINELVERAKEEGREAFKPVVIKMAARAELMAQGARPALVDRLVKMIDVSDVDIDDETGEIDVTTEVMQIKKDFAEYFGPRKATATRKRKGSTDDEGAGDEGGSGSGATKRKVATGSSTRRAGGAGGGDEGEGNVKKSSAQKLADSLMGIK